MATQAFINEVHNIVNQARYSLRDAHRAYHYETTLNSEEGDGRPYAANLDTWRALHANINALQKGIENIKEEMKAVFGD